jgi:hypothetical protein
MKRFDVLKAIEYLENYYPDRRAVHQDQLINALKAGIVDEAEKVDPDPIIQVWEMVNSRNDMEDLTVYAEDMWNAIKKYAEGK